jgi:hypothetical protein
MSRRIRTVALQGVTGGEADKYFDRTVKYVPADVVAAWTAVVAVIKGAADIAADNRPTVLLICLVVGVVAAFVWTFINTKDRSANPPTQRPAYVQSAVATIAFVVWVLALGDLNGMLGITETIGKLAVIGFTLVSGIIVPK